MRGTLQKAMTTWSGDLSASQNVPLQRRCKPVDVARLAEEGDGERGMVTTRLRMRREAVSPSTDSSIFANARRQPR